jgi:DedD protein
MERRVKERLIGATILVAFVVLIVPELLSGPKSTSPQALGPPAATPDGHRTVEVSMPGAKDPMPSSEPAASAPVASASVPESIAETPAATPAVVPPPAAPAPRAAPERTSTAAPVETPATAPTSATRAWAVQLGSFASRENAEKMQRELKAQGFSVYTSSQGVGSALRYRVRVGPLADRDSAERIAAKLKALGHEATIVPPAA